MRREMHTKFGQENWRETTESGHWE